MARGPARQVQASARRALRVRPAEDGQRQDPQARPSRGRSCLMPDQQTADRVEVAPVRDGENLDWERLERYLRDQLDVDGPFRVERFPHGTANLTYRIAFSERLLVLRRPPFGEIAAGGLDMGREYRA